MKYQNDYNDVDIKNFQKIEKKKTRISKSKNSGSDLFGKNLNNLMNSFYIYSISF